MKIITRKIYEVGWIVSALTFDGLASNWYIFSIRTATISEFRMNIIEYSSKCSQSNEYLIVFLNNILTYLSLQKELMRTKKKKQCEPHEAELFSIDDQFLHKSMKFRQPPSLYLGSAKSFLIV